MVLELGYVEILSGRVWIRTVHSMGLGLVAGGFVALEFPAGRWRIAGGS